MNYYFTMTLRHDDSNFRHIAQMQESSAPYLVNMRIEAHILVKNDSRIPLPR